MKLYYYRDDVFNFGDDLNAWLWPKLLPGFFDDDSSHLFLGIGTILNHKLPEAQGYTVVGSGWGYGEAPFIGESWNVLCVRGKISCEALGISPKYGIIDPAYLLCDFIVEPIEKRYSVSLIPHALSLENGCWQEVCDCLGIHLIDSRTTDIEHFVREVRMSKKILTEAMHGAIVSDCFCVPWQGYRAYSYINEVKWNDWLSVLDSKLTLAKVDSLYKGYVSLSPGEVLKSEVKHLIRACDLWRDGWSAPVPRKTPRRVEDNICRQLQCLINNGKFLLTDRFLVERQLDKLRNIIYGLSNYL